MIEEIKILEHQFGMIRMECPGETNCPICVRDVELKLTYGQIDTFRKHVLKLQDEIKQLKKDNKALRDTLNHMSQ